MRAALIGLLFASALAFAEGSPRRTSKSSRRTPTLTIAPIVIQSPIVPAGSRFVMSHFKSNNLGGDERLYISVSPDALNWTALNNGNPVWQPVGWAGFQNVVRDPAIIFDSGYYWVAYTSGNYGRHASFGLLKSTDLLNWTLVGEIACAVPGATGQLTWNPSFFRDGDGSVHILIAISPDGAPSISPIPNLRAHEIHPANADWTQWSTPVPLALPSTNTNEFFAWREGATYHAIYVDFQQNARWIHVTSNNLISGWGGAVALGHDSWEGGQMLKKPNGGYRLFIEPGNNDRFVGGGYRYVDGSSTFNGFNNRIPRNEQVLMRNGKMTTLESVSTFAQWQIAKLNAMPAAQQSPLADPDGDGLPNLIECALDLNPLASDFTTATPVSLTESTGQNYATLRHRRLRQLAGVSYVVESSGDLYTWNPAQEISATLMSDGTELVEARDTVPTSSGSRFIRLRVTLQP